MTVLIVEPLKTPQVAEIENSVEALCEIVGGPIESVTYFEGQPVALVVNQVGKIMGLPWNRALRDPKTKTTYDIIAGTFVVCGAPKGSEELVSLTDEQIEHFTLRFFGCEFFSGVKNPWYDPTWKA